MFSVLQYLEMAREYLREAERTPDPTQRRAFIEAAKQYSIAARDLQNGIDAANELATRE
jgi:hypothetical protein